MDSSPRADDKATVRITRWLEGTDKFSEVLSPTAALAASYREQNCYMLDDITLGVVMQFAGMRTAAVARATSTQFQNVTEKIGWRECVLLEGRQLAGWRACFPKAKAVRVANATDADLLHVSGVQFVHLEGCTEVTDEGLKHLGFAKRLYLAECARITDEGLAHLSSATDVVLGACYDLTDAGILAVSQN